MNHSTCINNENNENTSQHHPHEHLMEVIHLTNGANSHTISTYVSTMVAMTHIHTDKSSGNNNE